MTLVADGKHPTGGRCGLWFIFLWLRLYLTNYFSTDNSNHQKSSNLLPYKAQWSNSLSDESAVLLCSFEQTSCWPIRLLGRDYLYNSVSIKKTSAQDQLVFLVLRCERSVVCLLDFILHAIHRHLQTHSLYTINSLTTVFTHINAAAAHPRITTKVSKMDALEVFSHWVLCKYLFLIVSVSHSHSNHVKLNFTAHQY